MGIQKVDDAEVDEMESFVSTKKAPRWLWPAMDHHTGTVLAYVFGRRKEEVFLELHCCDLRFLAPTCYLQAFYRLPLSQRVKA